MAGVVLAAVRVVVVPAAIVDRNPHLRRISVVQAICAAVVLVAPEVLGVVHVGIVVEAIPVLGRIGLTPSSAISLLRGCLVGLGAAACGSCQQARGK